MSNILNNMIEFLAVLVVMFFAVSFVSRVAMKKMPLDRLFARLQGSGAVASNFISAVIGAVTPFCVCTTIPVFTGMVQMGLKTGPAMAFLFSSPLLNISAVILIYFLFGWKFAVYFTAAILFAATLGGILVPKLGMEDGIEGKAEEGGLPEGGSGNVCKDAARSSASLLKNLLLPLILGAVIAGLIHNYIPVKFIERFNGFPVWLAIPLVALIGFPLYSNILVLAPICFSLADKGMNSAVVMTFMMSGAGISFPSALVLNRILKRRLYLYYLGYTFLAYCIIGLGFNLVR
ncbi:MAG: permease [Candidatus Omnitrophota bacterium]|jgi:hypothetical protein